MSAATVGVEPIGAELRPLLTSRERRLSLRRTTHAVVARRPGDRPRVLGVGRDVTALVGVAAELSLTCAARYVEPGMAVPGQTDACVTCGEPAVVAVAEVGRRRVPYWRDRLGGMWFGVRDVRTGKTVLTPDRPVQSTPEQPPQIVMDELGPLTLVHREPDGGESGD